MKIDAEAGFCLAPTSPIDRLAISVLIGSKLDRQDEVPTPRPDGLSPACDGGGVVSLSFRVPMPRGFEPAEWLLDPRSSFRAEARVVVHANSYDPEVPFDLGSARLVVEVRRAGEPWHGCFSPSYLAADPAGDRPMNDESSLLNYKPEADKNLQLTTRNTLKGCPVVTGFSRGRDGELTVEIAGRNSRFAGDGTTGFAIGGDGSVIYARGKGTLSEGYDRSIDTLKQFATDNDLTMVKR